jgi:DNA-binding transcriptional ArsR family regulator
MAADSVGPVFAALADPTRRTVVETVLRLGEVSVPELTALLPMSRQAVAKHVAALQDAGLLERQGAGRALTFRLEPRALREASAWLDGVEREWDSRLARLKSSVEGG